MGSAIKKVIAVVGPTASGKSGFAVNLALALDGEVISGDSMQIYRGMDIGTAKVTAQERRGVPHHLLDLRRPGEGFSAAEYQSLARASIEDIFRRGKTPILAGGTGLYIDSALYNYEYTGEKRRGGKEAAKEAAKEVAKEAATGTAEQEDEPRGTGVAFREILRAEAAEKGGYALWEKLRRADPDSAGKIHPNDTKRIIRALEYFMVHQKPISQNTGALSAPVPAYPVIFLGLSMPRAELYQQIDRRADRMAEAGLLAETEKLAAEGLSLSTQAGQAIGYKQLLLYRKGDWSLAEAFAAVKRESRRYAKRQLTWFRRNPDICWLDGRKVQAPSFAGELAELLLREEGPEKRPEKAAEQEKTGQSGTTGETGQPGETGEPAECGKPGEADGLAAFFRRTETALNKELL